MDIKQFNLLQQTVQFAVDEEKHARETGLMSHFNMGSWLTFGFNAQARGLTFKPIVDVPGLETCAVVEGVSLSKCGTAACLAGTAVMLHGADKPLISVGAEENVDGASHVLTEDGKLVSIMARARDLLGLTEYQADKLFYMTGSSIEEIVDYCKNIANLNGHKLEVIM